MQRWPMRGVLVPLGQDFQDYFLIDRIFNIKVFAK